MLWLHGQDGALGSFLVEIAGVALAVGGLALLVSRLGPLRRWRDTRPEPVGDGGAVADEELATPATAGGTPSDSADGA